MASFKLLMAVAVQEGWPLYHFDVTQAFVQAKMITDVYMRLPEGCSILTDKTVKLENPFYGIKQAGRQWSRLLCQTLLEDIGMVQSKADSCVVRMEDAGDVHVVLLVHVDDIVISGTEENAGEVGKILNKTPRTISERPHGSWGVQWIETGIEAPCR
ncbi:unnamed protein product [Sphacelaria rigidula]